MKKILTKLLFILPLTLCTLSFVSCNDEEEYMDLEATGTGKFVGAWEGTFSGDDSGTWEFSVDNKGSITGTLVSKALPQTDFELAGRVNLDGEVSIDYIYSSVKIGSFKGTMIPTNVSGNWNKTIEGGQSGTWSGAKIK